MAQQIGEVISQVLPSQELSLAQALENFSHIELTEDEVIEAMIWAKRKKELKQEEQHRRELADKNRKLFTENIWAWDTCENFIRQRAMKMFNGLFKWDGQAGAYFDLLIRYFSKDKMFLTMAKNMGVENPSFDKGLYIGGNFGVGKTWLMKLFQRNQRQVYTLQNAKAIADLFESDGEEAIRQFSESPTLPSNDVENFYHARMGLCIDDLGTEQIKNHYGNKKNVMGDLIELRYAKGHVGPLFHVTTNLTGDQLNSFYGGRVASRLRECMNVIDFIGEDLRR